MVYYCHIMLFLIPIFGMVIGNVLRLYQSVICLPIFQQMEQLHGIRIVIVINLLTYLFFSTVKLFYLFLSNVKLFDHEFKKKRKKNEV